MKTILLIAIPLAVIIGLGIFMQGMLDRNADEISKLLDELEKQVNSENWEQADAKLEKISKDWQPVRKKWQAVIDHFEIDRIDDTFSRLKAFVKAEEDEDCLAEIAVLKQTFQHIPEKERMNFSNIL
jgi:uncharacterized protein YoxC